VLTGERSFLQVLTGSHPYADGAGGLEQIVENIENPAKVPTLDPQRHGTGEYPFRSVKPHIIMIQPLFILMSVIDPRGKVCL